MQRVDKLDVFGRDSLDRLELVLILSNASHRNSQTVVEFAVRDRDISAICFHRYTVISVINSPLIERDMGRSDGIGSIGVRCIG